MQQGNTVPVAMRSMLWFQSRQETPTCTGVDDLGMISIEQGQQHQLPLQTASLGWCAVCRANWSQHYTAIVNSNPDSQ